LPLYGDGRQVRDWLFVEDHCSGIELVLREGAPGEIYNVGGGDEVENITVAERIIELTGADRALLRRVDDRPGHDRRYSLDTTKLESLGWAPQTTFDKGLAETVSWYTDHRDWWEQIKSGEYRAYYERQYADRLANATSA
jgi:dTDP-glucose 4,6-dehydratase